MSRKRLHKSSDAIISGVCGGVAEYFGIDPTLVRILAVVLVIAGMGLPLVLYVICMLVIPSDPAAAQGYVDTRAEEAVPPCKQWRAYASSLCNPAAAPANQPPPPDPTTRVSAAGSASSVRSAGAAQSSSRAHNAESLHTTESAPASGIASAAKSHWSMLTVAGVLLIGIGIMALLCNFVHISLWRFWPVVLVVAGLVSLFTPSSRGWSLERAGNAIVLISIGLVLLAWMLQIVHTRTFFVAFINLWPAFLVVAGLAVIAAARKSSVIALLGSLVLSTTVLFGVLLYSGVDLWSLEPTLLHLESDGFQEFFSDVFFWK